MWHRLMLLAGVAGLAACSPPANPGSAGTASAPVSAAQDVATVQTAAALPQQFIAFGNEPFWSVRVDGQKLHWNSPENMQGIVFTASIAQLPAQRRYSGKLADAPVSLVLSAGPCSDGMSDDMHPFTVRWTIDGRALDGCARLPQ